MTNKDIMKIALKQSAKDYGFDVNDLINGSFKIFKPQPVSEEARNYLTKPPYCQFVYYGQSLVAITDDEIKDFVEKYLSKYKSEIYRVFDAPQINTLNNKLEKYGKCIAHISQTYLPDLDYQPKLNRKIKTKLFIEDEILELYNDKRFSMALNYKRTGRRVDVIAVVAYIGGEVVGVAGATNDCETMWQIGIDVLNEHRNKGIASTLTYLLSQEILNRGKVPFYCCAWSNLASKNTARKAGFKDAWIELTAKSIDEDWIKEIRKV